MSKTPPNQDPIYEPIPDTHTGALLQVSRRSVTKTREKVAAVMEIGYSGKSWTIQALQQETQLPQKSIRRVVDTFLEEGLAHYSATFKAYFLCKKPERLSRRKHCHSFGICENCGRVGEFVHAKHAHPRIRYMKVTGQEHEWLTLCLSCKKP